MRRLHRENNELRKVSIKPYFVENAEGSCLIEFGNTRVICTATIEENVPGFLRGKASGWVTAEYGMLPRSTHMRMRREAGQGKQQGRTHEIQRLIGRSLRSCVDLARLGERQIIIDCDVIHADGGTRTASITGGYVALYLALQRMAGCGMLRSIPILNHIAAISVGISGGDALLDLDYEEDSKAEVDANFVINSSGMLVEVQASAEKMSFSEGQLSSMLKLAKSGVEQIIEIQKQVLGI